MRGSHCRSTTYDECALQCAQENLDRGQRGSPRFINPHRLFHGVWLPQWLEERPEVSEKAKKLYAYLTYFAGGKGHSWPSFGLLGEKLHCSRRHVIRLVQELSTHRLITVTSVSNPEGGHCANYYRFLWHPWMQTERDAKFVLETVDSEPVDFSEESAPDNCQACTTPGDICVTSPLVTSRSPAPGDIPVTSPGDIHVTPLVTPMSPQENNKKRTNNRGKVPVAFSKTVTCRPPETTASPPPRDLSDATKIILERRIADLRKEIVMAVRRGLHDRAVQLHTELAAHQTKLGFTPDDPPRGMPPASRKTSEPELSSDWPSPEEVSATFNELRRSMGLPIKP